MSYSGKDIGVMCFSAGLLVGMLVAFASCAAQPDLEHDHITTGAHQ